MTTTTNQGGLFDGQGGDLVVTKEAAEILGLSIRRVNEIITAAGIKNHVPDLARGRGVPSVYARADIERLRDERARAKDLVRICEVVKATGRASKTVRGLIAAGKIGCILGEDGHKRVSLSEAQEALRRVPTRTARRRLRGPGRPKTPGGSKSETGERLQVYVQPEVMTALRVFAAERRADLSDVVTHALKAHLFVA